MKRVLQVFDSLEISGGVQAVVMNIYRCIDRERVQFDFAVYDAPKQNSYQQEIEALGGKVIPVQNLSSAGIKGFYGQFRSLFRERSYDAVHAHNIHHNGLILLAAERAGVPIRISHSHQAFDERNQSIPRKALSYSLKLLNMRAATRKIACSDLAGRFLYGDAPFEFLPNAIDIERFISRNDRLALRHQYGFNDDKELLLLFLGRIYPQKNPLFLADIMERLKDHSCKLLIAGDGPLRNALQDSCAEKGIADKVIFLGLRKDAPQLLGLADCLILPSIYEGLPMVAVEAQAAGCYSLISDRVTRQADLGLGLVKYLSIDSAETWAREIKSIQKDPPPKDLIVNRMKELRFDSESNLKAWYELYGVKGQH